MNSEEFAQNLAILEKIARSFPTDSAEAKAIELAAELMHFLRQLETRKAFLRFLSERDQPLTPEMVLHLRAIGVDPEAFGEDD